MIACAIAMLFLNSIGWSPASDAIVVTCVRKEFLNSVYAQPLQKTFAKLRVLLTLK